MNRKVYLDNAATTKLDDRVRDAMLPWLGEYFGNPSSVHSFGQDANLAINDARLTVANSLGCIPEEIFFTSSATEANNLALRGIAHANRDKGNHIITTVMEHACVLNTCKDLETQGFEVTYLPISKDGFVNPEDLKNAIKKETIMASIMWANNEIGTIQPMKEIIAVAKEAGIILHSDGVAAFPTLHTGLEKYPVDVLTLSAHKFHGPMGVGILRVHTRIPFTPMITGGGQEFERRAGTQNVPAIVGTGIAMSIAMDEKHSEVDEHIRPLRDELYEGLLKMRPDMITFGNMEQRIGTNLNVGFPGKKAENLLVELDLKGIAVSLGSACSSGKKAPSHVIRAMGYDDDIAYTSLRMSLSKHTSKDDIAYTLETFASLLT